uniref:Retrovirus-related Pol polyprotein from transposon TNT 1-94 n=1 Tax=Tanacetum cinerariifolium TaxID=118510 RepID=A0A6L2LZV3_TANCI|nr:retrovirus-related Pol polyprotein from transposon TNT 1-94 [Tanacetum cinerariifolium]
MVEENLHIKFSESTPNVVGTRPDWLFDIDALTRSMTYELIVVGTQSNGFAVLKSSHDDGSKPSSDDGKKVDEDLEKEAECKDQEKEDNVNSTNNVNTVSLTVNVANTNEDNELPFDLNMPALEDVSIFNFSNDDEDDGIVADMNNLDTTIQIKEEVYVCQPSGFEDLDFPDRVYKVKKALYGLHQAPKAWYMGELTFFLGLQVKQKKDGIFISQDKHIAEISKKFGFTDVKTASKPMETQKPLLKDEDGKEVDVHMYRSMISLLMYLTSSRPDIMFVVCACAGYQVNLKVSHFHVVKRIFRYLKGQPKLGFWYLKDSPFDLVAYIDSDYAGASLDRKFTTKDKNVTDLLTKAVDMPTRKVTQVPQPSDPMKHVVDEAVHKELGDSLVKAAIIASSLKAEQDSGGEGVFVLEQEVVKDVNDNVIEEVVNAAQESTATTTITTKKLTLAQALEALKTSKPKVKWIVIQEQEEPGKSTTTTTTSTMAKQQSQDKGKRIIIEEPVKHKKKDQIRLNEEAAKRLEAQKQKELPNAEKATLFVQLLEKRRKHLAAKRVEEKRNKPPTQAQKRKIIEFKRVNTFEDFRTKLVEGKEKRAREELIQESTKKQKVEDDKETA